MIEPDPADPASSIIRVKAVPGSRKNQLAGPLGDRLKVKVAAPPEGGKANEAILELLAEKLRVKPRDLAILTGHASPEKAIRVSGVSATDATARLLG